MKASRTPDEFCQVCDRETIAAVDYGSPYLYCEECGTVYTCDECGAEMFKDGTCTRATCLMYRNRGDDD